MSNFFEIFNPGQRYTREQLDTEKLLVVNEAQGGSGPQPLDLDSGSVVLRVPPPPAATEPGDLEAAGTDSGPDTERSGAEGRAEDAEGG